MKTTDPAKLERERSRIAAAADPFSAGVLQKIDRAEKRVKISSAKQYRTLKKIRDLELGEENW